MVKSSVMKERVLIIEDDEGMAGLEKRFFEKEGFEARWAASAEEGLEALKGGDLPDLLVIDYRLPGMSGVEFMEKVKEAGLEIPSVILTGAGDENVAVTAMKLGAMEYLVKDPEAISGLPMTCRNVIRSFRLEKEKERLAEELKRVNRELKEANRRLEELSVKDDLTGAYNRRALMEALERETRRHGRYGTLLSLAILDLDGFKEVNDTLGHIVGDLVLKQFSSLIGTRARETDLICRYGGDEFAVVFPETGIEGAARICEDLVRLVGDYPFGEGGSPVRLTASAGVACAEENMTAEELLERADRHLYSAKKAGKGRVLAIGHGEDVETTGPG